MHSLTHLFIYLFVFSLFLLAFFTQLNSTQFVLKYLRTIRYVVLNSTLHRHRRRAVVVAVVAVACPPTNDES